MLLDSASNICATQLSLPTIFDVLASDDLDNLTKPLFNYVFNLLTKLHPSLNLISNRRKQFYLTIKTVIEWYLLKTSNASLSELFYGMERIPDSIYKKFWRIKSILFLIYLPFIKEKLDDLYNELKLFGYNSFKNQISLKSKILRQYLKWYPLVLALLKSVNFVFLVGYITNRTAYATFSLFLQKIKLTVRDSSTDNTYSRFRRWGWRSVQIIVFFLQFYDWWNTNGESFSFTSGLFKNRFKNISPPTALKSDEKNVTTNGVCPVCEKSRKIPAVIASTGILGCYECLLEYVQQNGNCPVTGCPSKPDDVMRLFIS